MNKRVIWKLAIVWVLIAVIVVFDFVFPPVDILFFAVLAGLFLSDVILNVQKR